MTALEWIANVASDQQLSGTGLQLRRLTACRLGRSIGAAIAGAGPRPPSRAVPSPGGLAPRIREFLTNALAPARLPEISPDRKSPKFEEANRARVRDHADPLTRRRHISTTRRARGAVHFGILGRAGLVIAGTLAQPGLGFKGAPSWQV